MTPYPYQLTIKGRTINGNLYSETGTYVGGRQRNSGQKGASESIEVRTADGKVQTLHLDYIIDPPDHCTITLLYFLHNERYYVFQIYIHETDSFHGISGDRLDNMIDATLSIGTMKRLWNRMLSKIIFLLSLLFAFAAMVLSRYLGHSDLINIVCTGAPILVCFLLRPMLMNLLGGTEGKQKALREELLPLSKQLIASLSEQQSASEDGYQAM